MRNSPGGYPPVLPIYRYSECLTLPRFYSLHEGSNLTCEECNTYASNIKRAVFISSFAKRIGSDDDTDSCCSLANNNSKRDGGKITQMGKRDLKVRRSRGEDCIY
ncbi:hypothetical protein ABW19_dt0205737 [Dactylella cylindrospora]|nr:hypothetical protein ABW19_dt0205737 [Dactylella cylindrospora]